MERHRAVCAAPPPEEPLCKRPLLVRLLGLYPPAWRERYGEELSELLAHESVTPFAVATVLWDALDAHLHPHLPTAGVVSAQGERLRLAALLVFGAFIGAEVAALFFGEAMDHFSFTFQRQTQPALQGPWFLLIAGAVVAALALLAGGLPIVLAVIRDARRRRSATVRALVIPPLAFLLLLVGDAVEKGRRLAQVQWPTGVDLTLDVFWHALLVLAAVISIGAVGLVVLQSQITDRLFRWALAPAVCGTLGLLVMLAAAVAWLVGARSAVPLAFAQDTITGSFVLLVGLLLITTVCAAQGVVRGLTTQWRRT